MKTNWKKAGAVLCFLLCIGLLSGCQRPGGAGKKEAEAKTSTCTISIECLTVLDNREELDSSKEEFVPEDGWILSPLEVSYTPEETVFDVLKRVCEKNGIHMASRYTPLYGSFYIEAINQLYEFDCGKNSGWTYCVNGKYPNYGCSEYTVEEGDRIEWSYTCDLGSDVGRSCEE